MQPAFFKTKGISDLSAFVKPFQSGTIGPWDINDGLPTLGCIAHLPVEIRKNTLFATGLIDDVIIGNAYASEAELAALGAINRYQTEFSVTFTESTSCERKDRSEEQHYRRGDITDRMIRSTEVRKNTSNLITQPTIIWRNSNLEIL